MHCEPLSNAIIRGFLQTLLSYVLNIKSYPLTVVRVVLAVGTFAISESIFYIPNLHKSGSNI
jgi:hypothetical protein